MLTQGQMYNICSEINNSKTTNNLFAKQQKISENTVCKWKR